MGVGEGRGEVSVGVMSATGVASAGMMPVFTEGCEGEVHTGVGGVFFVLTTCCSVFCWMIAVWAMGA